EIRLEDRYSYITNGQLRNIRRDCRRMGSDAIIRTFLLPFISIFGTIAAIGLVICGILSCISVSVLCILVGVYIILVGICVMFMEAPLIYKAFDIGVGVHNFTKPLKNWMKVILYFCLVIPMFLCLGFSNIIAIIFLCLLALGQGALWAYSGPDATTENPGGPDSNLMSTMGMGNVDGSTTNV
ncbi:hypothetical protein SARC_09570, partial [Sphaeroforma arctica JP610]